MKRMLVIYMFCLVFCGLSFGQKLPDIKDTDRQPKTEERVLREEKPDEPRIDTRKDESPVEPNDEPKTLELQDEPGEYSDDEFPLGISLPQSKNREKIAGFTKINYVKGGSKYSYGTVLHCYQTTNSLSTFVQCLDSFEYFFDNKPDTLLNEIPPNDTERNKNQKTDSFLTNSLVENYGIPD